MKFVMMVGIPGSGKTTKAQELAKELNATVFSSDLYRKKLFGNESDQTNNNLVFETLYKDLRANLKQGKNVILDATNTTLKSRVKALSAVQGVEEVYKIAYIVAPTVESCIARDNSRERKVGADVIRKFVSSFQCPQKFEGFDEIVISGSENGFPDVNIDSIIYLEKRMNDFNQLNPHHIYTLGEHCSRIQDNYIDVYSPEHLAAKWHDIGKLFTQTIDHEGIAHYYNHDSVGTYYLLAHPELNYSLNSIQEFCECLFYINYHMRAHRDFKGEKAALKYKKLFGEERYNNLMQFGEYDRIASGTYGKTL